MRDYFSSYKRQQTSGKKRPRWDILTLDDLPRTNWRYRELVAQLRARYRADKEQGKDKPKQDPEDFSI